MTKKDVESAEKKKAASEAENNGLGKNSTVKKKPAEKSIEELILNYGVGKYSAIPLAAIWAKELRRREENRHLTSNEILELALTDVLGGKVDWKDIKKFALNGSEKDVRAGVEEKSKGK